MTEEEDRFVSVAVYRGANEARDHARAHGAFFDAVVAACNEKAVETTGDAVFDPAGNVFPEYLEELKEVFLPPEGGEGHAQ